ncbi:MAG: CHAT domain-containing protein [Candidatus Eisenbacteria bacterium]|nr:CHAT domain-containing protein [Candidatus Eisenbacteria bacterium]
MRPEAREIEALLRLPATPDLLDRWVRSLAAPPTAPPFQVLYDALLGEYARDPRRAMLAVEHAERALARTLPDRERALLWRMEANIRIGIGDLQGAVRGFGRAFAAFAEAKLRVEQGRCCIGWLYALGLRGDLDTAMGVAQLGRRYLPRTSLADRARLEANLANAFLHAGRLSAADRGFRAAMARFRSLGLRGEVGVCRLNLGMTAWMKAETAIARRYLRTARTDLDRTGNRVLSLYAQTGLAALELVEGADPAGWERLQDVRREIRDLGDERALAWSHQELAVLLSSLGAYEAAAPEAEQAWGIFRRLGFRDESARAASLRGNILSSLGGNQLAMSLIEEARRSWQEAGCSWAVRKVEIEQARLLLREEDPVAARDLLRRLVRHLPKESARAEGAIARGLLAEAYLLMGTPGRALRLARLAHRSARLHPARWERPGLAMLVARSLAALGRSAEVMRWTRLSVRELEALLLRFGDRRMRLLIGESRARLFREAIDLSLRHGGARAVEIALDLVSQSRAPTLLEDLQLGGRATRRGIRSALTRLRDEMLRPDGDRTEARHRGLGRELDRLATIAGSAPTYTSEVIRRAREARGFRSWRTRLGDRQLVVFDRDRTGWYAFCIRGRGPVGRVFLPGLEAAIERYWIPLRLTIEAAAQVGDHERDRFLALTLKDCRTAMEQLRAALWEPMSLDPALPIVAVPGGELHALPIEALFEIGASRVPIGITRLPHPALLTESGRRTTSRHVRHALIVHGPAQGARDEATHVARSLREAGWIVEQGDQRDQLRRGQGRIDLLHVAAHGAFHQDGWSLSGIQLTDGWLGFEHLPRHRLRGSLIQFTSCESGRTTLFPGSDIDGWMTAGLGAGATALGLSLWKVDDLTAREWSRAFYRHWRQGGVSPNEAAGKARRALRERWEHPFRSAAFFVVG